MIYTASTLMWGVVLCYEYSLPNTGWELHQWDMRFLGFHTEVNIWVINKHADWEVKYLRKRLMCHTTCTKWQHIYIVASCTHLPPWMMLKWNLLFMSGSLQWLVQPWLGNTSRWFWQCNLHVNTSHQLCSTGGYQWSRGKWALIPVTDTWHAKMHM